MDNSDFEYDADRFLRALVMSTGGYKRAKECLLGAVTHWKELGAGMLQGNFTADLSEDSDLINGEVMGKKFVISFLPFVEEEKGYLEAIISTPNLVSGEQVEISRFLVAANGSVLSSSKEELLSWDDGYLNYRLLVAVSRRVLSATAQV